MSKREHSSRSSNLKFANLSLEIPALWFAVRNAAYDVGYVPTDLVYSLVFETLWIISTISAVKR